MGKTTMLQVTINGCLYKDYIPEDLTLLDYLREYRGLMGSKKACEEGECGACSVIVDSRVVYSCIMFAVQVNGKNVETIEGLNTDDKLHPIQEAFIEAGAIQCGFCTPGFIMATKALLDRNSNPDEEQILEGISGSLCRCTGYTKIVEAVKIAAKKLKDKGGN